MEKGNADLQAKLECPDGMEEEVWARSLGLSVEGWRYRLERAREGRVEVMSPRGALMALRDEVAEEIGESVARGGKLSDLAVHYGMRGGELRAWIFGDAKRLAAYEAGLRGRAEELADEALEYRDRAIEIADRADIEGVPVSKLQVDVRFKAAALNLQLAAKYDPRRFGEDRSLKLDVGVKGEGELMEQLRELTREPEMREMLKALLNEGVRVVDGESERADDGG